MGAADAVDLMIEWLQQNRAEVGKIDFGRVLFDLYGGEVKARVERSEKLRAVEKKSA